VVEQGRVHGGPRLPQPGKAWELLGALVWSMSRMWPASLAGMVAACLLATLLVHPDRQPAARHFLPARSP